MGEVYRATQKDLDRPVAIKVMKGELVADESLKTRFRRELEALAKLQHPRIVAVYDVDFAGKIPFYVMELVEAPNLAKILMTRRPLGIAESLVIFQDLLEALSACHQRHLLHRDIKPENVLVQEDGHGKLTDFGLVKWVDRTVITMDDEMIGTPSYMAPEMVAGTEVDVRSDYYQAGMVLYEMVAGKRAIHAETLEEIWELVLKKVPESPRLFNPECPPALATLISNLLEKKPADRYGTADEIFADLARVRAGEDVVRRRATRKERQAPGQPQSALPAAGQRQAQATPSPSAGVAARQDPHAGQPVPEFTDPKAPPAPRSRPQPVGTKPARAAQRSDQQGFPLRLKLDLVLFVPLGGFVIWEFLLHRTYPLLWIVFLGLLVETAVTAWKTLMGVAAPAAFREPITVDNKLNVPVRLDFRGKTMGCVIERIDARSQCVIDVEVGAVMLFRREDNNAQVKKDVARKGLTIVLQDVRKG
ncbi:MAG: protein kinase [Candidatus Riflebacteria bacterium]|nr:protein kinase [Candidatus Riflebacteria bacterium]